MRPAHKALAVLLGGVIVYDFLAPDGETISEGVDELLEKYPLATYATIDTIARHLRNELGRADPLALGFAALRALRRRPVVVVVESLEM